MSDEDRTLGSVAEIDAEIERLQREREEYKRTLEDPDQREARRVRREQIMGRWAAGLRLGDSHLDGIRRVAADEAWLFAPNLMQEDDWKRDADKGQWTLPAESSSG